VTRLALLAAARFGMFRLTEREGRLDDKSSCVPAGDPAAETCANSRHTREVLPARDPPLSSPFYKAMEAGHPERPRHRLGGRIAARPR